MSLNACYDTFLGHPIKFPEKLIYIAQTPVWSDLLKGTQLVRDGTQSGVPHLPSMEASAGNQGTSRLWPCF